MENEENLTKQEIDSEQKPLKQKLITRQWRQKSGFMRKLMKFFQQYTTKRNLIIIACVIAVLGVAAALRLTIFKPAPKQVYQVAIMVRSQNNPDPIEDRRTSLKRGDVLVVQGEKHKFSKTESVSYLILKMKLNEEQAAKLTSADEKQLSEDEINAEIAKRNEERTTRAAESDYKITDEEVKREEEEIRQRRITIRPRLYFIDLSRGSFSEFEANDLLEGQPFMEKVYRWGIVSKKKEVK